LDAIVTENEPLAPHTWFNIGGPARWFAQPTTEAELQSVLQRAAENRLSVRILGQGANLLVDDAGVEGVVIRLAGNDFGELTFEGETVRAGAGVSLGKLISESIRNGLAGPETLAGIPGTVGGAIHMNAGGKGGDIGTLVERVQVIDPIDGKAFWREKPDLAFDYRECNLGSQIVCRAEFTLISDEPKRLLDRMREIWIIKKSTQPMSSRSAGCVFKNPLPGQSAGALIDRAGLKGKTVGGARISEQHANFILAEDGATFADVMALITLAKTTVFDKFGIELQREVEVWSDRSDVPAEESC
jgi:UDP-N-acetylmuramate dehydrogenase